MLTLATLSLSLWLQTDSFGATSTRVLFSPYSLEQVFLGHALPSVLMAVVMARSAYSLFQQHMFNHQFVCTRCECACSAHKECAHA